MRTRKTRRHPIRLAAGYGALALYLAFLLIPFIWVFYSSFRSESSLFSGTFLQNPEGLTLRHYADVFSAATGQFPVYFRNSLLVATIASAVVVGVALPGAYGLSRFAIRFKREIIMVFLMSQMFPHVLLLIPLFSLLLRLQLVNTHAGVIVAHIILGIPFSLWLLKGYFDGVPKELDEAAMIDGASPTEVLVRIVMPLVAPGVVVAAFYSFMVSWGDFLFSSVIAQAIGVQTLPIGLNKFFGATQIRWGPITAATVITIVPTVALFALLQRWVVEGLTSGAVKG